MPNPVSLGISDTPYDQLIRSIISVEREPQRKLKSKRNEQDRLKSVLSDLDSKLSGLDTQLTSLTDPVTNPFEARAASVPDGAGFSATASDSASTGSHTLSVDRLAKADNRVSQDYNAAGTDLDTFFDNNGAQTFDVSVAHEQDDGTMVRKAISVTVDPTDNLNNEDTLKEISSAIDQAMSDAVDAGTISKDEAAASSVVNETTDTARLSLRSGQTGYDHRLQFNDSAGGLLGQLQVNANQQADGTQGGYITDPGTSADTSQLNSKFTLDGLTLYRNSNEVSDALEGVTLSLNETFGSTATFTIEPDSESITSDVKTFIEKYNAALDYINKKTNIDGESGERGDFASDSAIKRLQLGMRTDIAESVNGQPSGAPDALHEIGITQNDDGTLELSDEDKLISSVEDDASAVQSLFASDDGVATRLENRLDRFLKIDGLIDRREDATQSKIDRLDDRIQRWDERMARREEQLRAQYAQLQSVTQQFQRQQQSLGNFFGGGF